MHKLIGIAVAALFAVSAGAFAQAPATKSDAKAPETKTAPAKKGEKAAKKGEKKAEKKAEAKGDAKAETAKK